MIAAEPILSLIRQKESGSSYDVVWGGIDPANRPHVALTSMTIREVLAWQDSIDPFYPSEAAGAYQILEDTLRGLWASTPGINLDSQFDEGVQDRLAFRLLQRRGWDDFMAGRITAEKYANALAKEWASFPVVTGPKKGRSYYAGDGLNKALTTPEEVLQRLAWCRKPPAVQPTIWDRIAGVFGRLFCKETST